MSGTYCDAENHHDRFVIITYGHLLLRDLGFYCRDAKSATCHSTRAASLTPIPRFSDGHFRPYDRGLS